MSQHKADNISFSLILHCTNKKFHFEAFNTYKDASCFMIGEKNMAKLKETQCNVCLIQFDDFEWIPQDNVADNLWKLL